MYIYYNPNPASKLVGDCVIRGVAKVTNQTWDEVYTGICLTGFDMKDMPSSNNVWASYLISKGFGRTLLKEECPMCYTVKDFCKDYKVGTFLLATGRYVSRDPYPNDMSYRRSYGDPYMNGYSGHNRMIDELERMRDSAQTEHERRMIDEWIKSAEMNR